MNRKRRKNHFRNILKPFLALLLSLTLCLNLSSCIIGSLFLMGDALGIFDEEEDDPDFEYWASEHETERPTKPRESESESTETTEAQETASAVPESTETAQNTETTEAETDSQQNDEPGMQVNSDSGDLVINRPSRENETSMGDPGIWTVFVYLCGTDLESASFSQGGMGTADLKEMISSSKNPAVRFVVETGGTKYWYNDTVSAGQNERFLIEKGEITKLSDLGKRGMGAPGTLLDFLNYGIENYASEKMAIVFWNHGGGSITGVCFDELFDNDSLTLREIDAALSSVSRSMTDRFELIGFDACLMGTLETANILANYARYMVASEESEPGSGWDYSAFGPFLEKNPNADGAAFGRMVCDSFYEACAAQNDSAIATLSVVNLQKIDPVLVSFNRFSQQIYEAGSNSETLTELVRGIRSAENFGGNNRVDGYTNMVDLGGLVKACSGVSSEAENLLSLLSESVVYKISGKDHPNASGLSLYYPLEIQGSSELSTFSEICASPYYLSFVDRQAYGGATGGDTDSYDDDTWFEDDGFWSWLFEDDYYGDDEDYNWEEDYYGYDYPEYEDEYWDYLDDYETTGESSLITFAVPPQLDEDGSYYFILDDDGYYYTSDVIAYVYQLSADEEDVIELGETIDVYADWDEGYFEDIFDGYWISLPDGQNLALYVVDYADDYVLYSSPIYLNDEETNLRIRQYYDDGTIIIEGAFDGVSEYGASNRETKKVNPGDVIIPRYFAWNLDTEEDLEYYGYEYTVTDDMELYYDIMDPGDYFYAFCIDDIFGDYYMTDFAVYTVDEEGNITYYE